MGNYTELEEIVKEYLKENGQVSLGDIDTPSFIRKRFNLAYREPSKRKISSEVPGRVTNLLNALFGEEDVQFA